MRPRLDYSIRLKLTLATLTPLFASILIFWIAGFSALHWGLPDQHYQELRGSINLFFSTILLFASVIGIAVSTWLGDKISRPIKELEMAARQITAGEYLPDIVLGSHDELAVLAEEFNIMKHRLIERENENLALNFSLEENVRERTAQLEEKNHWLLVAQQELARAERLVGIGMLASGVAHEINNPLAIIRGNAELLEMSGHLDESARSEVDTIMQQVGRVERIVANLLTFARTQQITTAPIPLKPLLDDILNQLGHQISLRNFTIERLYRDCDITVVGDGDQLRQVFTNLIVNGLQAMEGGGVLTVDARSLSEAARCQIMIRDTGCGIDQEQQQKLFSPFYTTKPHGTGLGLAVTYGIVKDHGGDIEVASEPGAGALFVVTLPLAV